jgi:hypothetical protein
MEYATSHRRWLEELKSAGGEHDPPTGGADETALRPAPIAVSSRMHRFFHRERRSCASPVETLYLLRLLHHLEQ